MPESLYTAVVSASQAGREGVVRSDDGRLEASLSIPRVLGGDDGPGTNPEQLLAAGWAGCFASAVASAGRRAQTRIEEIAVTARVEIVALPEQRYGFAAELEVRLPGVSQAEAAALVAEADRICPFSNAMRGTVPVTLTVHGAH